MERALKQRLVGAGVIIALGVVFIPMILDGKDEKAIREIPAPPGQRFESSPGMVSPDSIPLPPPTSDAQPVLETDAEPEPDPKESAQHTETPEPSKPEPEAPVEKSEPVAKTETVSQPAGSAETQPAKQAALASWVVQVGSFTDRDKAFKLRDQLRSKNYRAFVEKFAGRSGQALYRVRIGPDLKREDSEKILQALQKKEKIKGFVTSHP